MKEEPRPITSISNEYIKLFKFNENRIIIGDFHAGMLIIDGL